MAVVTIARLTGSGGDVIAARVAEGLRYDLIDSALLTKIAEHAGVRLEQVMGLDERCESRMVKWLLKIITPKVKKIIHEEEPHLKPEGYIEYLTHVIHGMAEKGKIVIVGRGGQFILREMGNAFHVRVIADQSTRVNWLKQSYEISEEEALDRIKRSDAMKRNFSRRYFRKDWDDPLLYHVMVNTSRLPVEEASEMIIGAVRKFGATRDYIPGVREQRRVDRRSAERRKGDRRDTLSIWTLRDVETALLKTWRPVRTLNKPDRRKGERRKGSRRDKNVQSQ
jgi:hypothetical protein